MMDKAKFYEVIRPKLNLTTQNVMGMDKALDYGEAHHVRLNDFSYALATDWWETAQTMHPVKEAYWLSEAWRKANLRYYPWYGRGLIQTTWEDNYRKIAVAMGLPADTFTKNPDLLLTFEYALPALFIGMEKGTYTGKKLSDFIDDVDEDDAEDLREFVAARKIVNGTDQAKKIGDLALLFERALKRAGYMPTAEPLKPAVPQPPLPHVIVQEITKKPTWWDWIKSLFGA